MNIPSYEWHEKCTKHSIFLTIIQMAKYRLNDIGGKGSEIENFPSSMSVK